MARRKWSDAVREQRYGPAPAPKEKTPVGRCKCGAGTFRLRVVEGNWTRRCLVCEEVTQI